MKFSSIASDHFTGFVALLMSTVELEHIITFIYSLTKICHVTQGVFEGYLSAVDGVGVI